MKECHACKSTNIQRARNDSGHFKADGIRPTRIYQYRCSDCGYVTSYAKTPEQLARDGEGT